VSLREALGRAVGALLLVAALVAAARLWGQTPPVAHYRYHGAWALPDTGATPGQVETSAPGVVCTRTTTALRHVTPAMHHAIYAEYGIAWAQHAGYEDDHLISLELGGTNDNRNRWPQPYPAAFSKDSVENWSHRMACSGRLSLSYIQRQIARDWVVLYKAMHRDLGH
jgi:hypothetical protein